MTSSGPRARRFFGIHPIQRWQTPTPKLRKKLQMNTNANFEAASRRMLRTLKPPRRHRIGIPPLDKYLNSWVASAGGTPDYHAKLYRYARNIGEFLGPKAKASISSLHEADFAGLTPFLAQLGYSPTSIGMHRQALRTMFLAAEKKWVRAVESHHGRKLLFEKTQSKHSYSFHNTSNRTSPQLSFVIDFRPWSYLAFTAPWI